MGMAGVVWAAGPPPAAIPSEGKTRTHRNTGGETIFADGGSVFAMCSVKSRDVHTHKGRRPPQ